MKIIFAGTPDFSLSSLKALIESEHEVVAVYTQPDRPKGRGRKLNPSPVKELALQHHIAVYQPLNFKAPEDIEALKALNADLMVVVAYGLILPKAILDAPQYGCFNVHASLLPKYRGASPIQAVLLHGEKETGVTIQQMNEGLDTGDILSKAVYDIQSEDNSQILHDALSELGATLLLKTITALAQGHLHPEPQDNALASYAGKIKKEDAIIDWTDEASRIVNQIRAYNPWPVAQTTIEGTALRLYKATLIDNVNGHDFSAGDIIESSAEGIKVACGQGQLLVQTLQFPGKKAMPVAAILNSKKDLFAKGRHFGDK